MSELVLVKFEAPPGYGPEEVYLSAFNISMVPDVPRKISRELADKLMETYPQIKYISDFTEELNEDMSNEEFEEEHIPVESVQEIAEFLSDIEIDENQPSSSFDDEENFKNEVHE